MFRCSDYRSARLDLLYMKPEEGHTNPMDLTTDSGFVCLVWMKSRLQMRFCLLLLFRVGPSSKTSAWVYWFWFVDLHRTALATILRGDVRQGWLSLWALKCSSWTAVNAGTSGRSPCSSIGNTEYASVRDGNCLGSRNFAWIMRYVCSNILIRNIVFPAIELIDIALYNFNK